MYFIVTVVEPEPDAWCAQASQSAGLKFEGCAGLPKRLAAGVCSCILMLASSLLGFKSQTCCHEKCAHVLTWTCTATTQLHFHRLAIGS